MHGVDKKKEGRPKGALGKNVRWGFPAYANLWVMVHFLAYVYRRANYDYRAPRKILLAKSLRI